MKPNPLLKKLGLSNKDRVVIFHADDIGMCQASLSAYQDLLEGGLLSAAAVMVPCPWFPAAAAFCRAQPQAPDMGVHLTLTSEWDAYRWGPISTCNRATGLVDGEGYLYRDPDIVQEKAKTAAVQREIQAQVERALAAGIDVTHIDAHMGAIFHPRFIDIYVDLALQHRIPALLPRQDEAGFRELGFDGETAAFFAIQVQKLEAQALPLLDKIHMMTLDEHTDRLQQVKQALQQLPAGISYFIIHPAKETAELRAIAPDWRARVADYAVFMDQPLHHFIQESGIHVIGYRELRELMRQEIGA